MVYKRHYNVSNPQSFDLYRMLEEQYGIVCNYLTPPGLEEPTGLTFDIMEDYPQFDEISKLLPAPYLPEVDLRSRDRVPTVWIIYTAIYTQEELSQAQWLTARCITGKAVRDKFEQPLHLEKAFKWGRSHFTTTQVFDDVLLCSETIKNVLADTGIVGINYSPVYYGKSYKLMDGVYQMESTNTLEPKDFVPIRNMYMDADLKYMKYTDDKALFGIHKGVIAEGMDFCWTVPMFLPPGDLKPEHMVPDWRQLLVSGKFYNTLKERKLDRGIVFEPVEVIDV